MKILVSFSELAASEPVGVRFDGRRLPKGTNGDNARCDTGSFPCLNHYFKVRSLEI